MTPKATYQPSDEINQAIKGATLAWATAKDEKEAPRLLPVATTARHPDRVTLAARLCRFHKA